MRAFKCSMLLALLAAAGCEDGPDQVFRPRNTDPPVKSGDPWTQPGSRDFGSKTSGDSQGRARFCDEAETSALIEELVSEPIIPDVGIAGMRLWGDDGKQLHADELVGLPEDGKFCDPTGVYADAFTWGPTEEIIVFFNQETRLVEGMMAYQSYLGSMKGRVKIGNTTEEVVVKPRERIRIGGKALDQYTGRAQQSSRTGSWLNDANITKIYGMIRQQFFDAEPLPEGFNCVEEALCDVIYTAADDSVPQDTFLDFPDSGVQLRFTPEGQVVFVFLQPVRIAQFEVAGEFTMGDGAPAPTYTSTSRDTCVVDLNRGVTWASFRSQCIDSERELSRANFDVYTQRDAVSVGFNGITYDFLRETTKSEVFHDGEVPDDSDVLFGMMFTRSLQAPVAQFVPAALAAEYKTRLEARLVAAVDPEDHGIHPISTFDVEVPPSLSTAPQRIGALAYNGGESWVGDVVAEIRDLYGRLTPAQRAAVDPRVADPVFLLEPFVDAVLDAFSFGATAAPGAFKVFRTTDDERWSIGFGHFLQGGVPYRLIVQYSLNFGAVTAVTVERGESELDRVFHSVSKNVFDIPYYLFEMSSPYLAELNPYALGASGAIEVGEVDRGLGTLDVTLLSVDAAGAVKPVKMTVPGEHMDDRAGYLRQIRGERFEFVPAHEIRLVGKETQLLVHAAPDPSGALQLLRVEQFTYKGKAELCHGLEVAYGDDVRRAVEAWHQGVSAEEYQGCELVFNYSEDGTILFSVASLKNRVSVTVVAERAVSAATWL